MRRIMNRKKKEKSAKRILRLNVVYSIVFLSFTGLILRAAYVQIVRGSSFRTAEVKTEVAETPIAPQRGWIYDANGVVLAEDVPSMSVVLNKMASGTTADYHKMAKKLAPILKESAQKIYHKMTSDASSQVTLLSDASDKQVSAIEENHSEFPNVQIQNTYKRVYPYGDLAGHVLGYTSQSNLTNAYKAKGYDNIGAAGLEEQYESLLRGIPGEQQVEVNAAGQPIQDIGTTPAVAGDNLQLSLDGHMQAETQMIIQNAIDSSGKKYEINEGSAVMMNVKTGGVVAMASYPYMDPNWFTDGLSQKHYKYMLKYNGFSNNAIQSPQAPGSTVKPANLITGLKKGVITPSTTIDGANDTYIGQTDLHNDGENQGLVSAVKAIAESTDTYFYEVGLWLGKWFGSNAHSGGTYPSKAGSYQNYLDTDYVKGLNTIFQGELDFGLGEKTGIDLPEEYNGVFLYDGFKKKYDLKKAEKAIAEKGKYAITGTPADLAEAGIGQMQQFTPIQLAKYVTSLANNGKDLKPHLLDKVYDSTATPNSGAKPVKTVKTDVVGQVKAKAEYFQVAQEGMHAVAADPQGTAYSLFANAHYQIAAKTGTATITVDGIKTDNSVFIAYAPYHHPIVALAIMIPGGGYGAEFAGEVARKMFDAYFDEHHESFMPKKDWTNTKIPSTWKKSAAYQNPEHGER